MDEQSRRHRILIPDIAITQAGVTGCPLVHACVLLDLESSGGHNWFGAPRDPRGQPRFTEVTEQTYRDYLAHRDEHGSQGVGPLQLTWKATQDQADREGGCWDPRVNARVGFRQFADHLRRTGSARDSYSLYNTGRPGPSPYADRALALLMGWQRAIEGA